MFRSRFALAFTALAMIAGCGDDASAPAKNSLAFEGVAWVAPDEAGRLVVSWKPAPDAIDYRVYVSRLQGRQLKTAPIHTADTSVVVTPEKPGERYYFTVRAADVRGAEDANVVEKSAVASPDTIPPTFGGATVEPSGNAGARLSWTAASDDLTPPEAIVYEIFAGRSTTSVSRVAITRPGDVTVTLNQLGTPSETFVFSVRARDIANNLSAEGAFVTASLGQDATPPTFAGCETATSLGATSARVTWKPATDNHSPADTLSYEVYASTTPGQHDLASPLVKVVNGTEAVVTGLTPGSTYHFLCKARDPAGNLDPNTAERPVSLASDVNKPEFGGITDFKLNEETRELELKWAPAKDDQTPVAAILYDVFESRAAGTYDFDAPPRATSAPGAPSITIKDIASRSTLFWVVRARDAAGNRDDNLVERNGTTLTSYSIDVQGVFNRNCAVVGCHVTGPQVGGLNLSPTFSYDQLMASSVLNRPMPRVTPDDLDNSWLYIKIKGPPPVGLQMPAPQTGNALTVIDKEIITSWILSGAPKN